MDAMDRDSRVAGCCGEIAVALPGMDKGLMCSNPVVAAQVFEYKISHCMDKPLESWLGFITVLPGAFSAYRYAALTGAGSTDPSVRPPLQKYFASLHDPHRSLQSDHNEQSLWDANMYLAEDRILCFEIVATKGKDYRLEYVKNAVAYTDVPLKLNLLLKQRRRWLNGSFFAMLHALANFPRIFITTTHSVWRKMLLAFELLYFVINVCITWFVLGSFYMVFKLVLANALPDTHAWLVVQYLLTFLYAFTTAVVFVLSIGNDPVWTRRAYRWCSISYAVLFAIATLVQIVSIFSAVRVVWRRVRSWQFYCVLTIGCAGEFHRCGCRCAAIGGCLLLHRLPPWPVLLHLCDFHPVLLHAAHVCDGTIRCCCGPMSNAD